MLAPDQPAAPATFSAAIRRYMSGCVAATCTTDAGERHIELVDAFTSVSLDPPLVLLSVRAERATVLQTADPFQVHVLGVRHEELVRHLERAAHHADGEHAPVGIHVDVAGTALVTFGCRHFASYPTGDHVVLLGRVDTLQVAAGEDSALARMDGALARHPAP